MKRKLHFLSLAFVTLTATAQTNLLHNGSFDSAGLPRGNHWYDFCIAELTYLNNSNQYQCAGAPVDMVYDHPASNPPGDTISVHCQTLSPGGCGITQYISGQSGTNIYQLKFWMKSMPALAGGGSSSGAVTLAKYSGVFQYQEDTTIVNTGWQQYTLVDTITTVATDSIYVELKSTGPDMAQGQVYFDNAELTIIGTITSSADERSIVTQEINVYPVPARDLVLIEFSNEQKACCTIKLFNVAGQNVKTFSGNQSSFKLERNDLQDGIYFFEIEVAGKSTGKGKILFED